MIFRYSVTKKEEILKASEVDHVLFIKNPTGPVCTQDGVEPKLTVYSNTQIKYTRFLYENQKTEVKINHGSITLSSGHILIFFAVFQSILAILNVKELPPADLK